MNSVDNIIRCLKALRLSLVPTTNSAASGLATVLPSGKKTDITDRFGIYFAGTIAAIRSDLDNSDTPPTILTDNERACLVPLC